MQRLRSIFILFFIATVPQLAGAAVVRGVVYSINGYKQPHREEGVVVDILGLKDSEGTNKGRTPQVLSGADGMYYIEVPPGSYTVEIWPSKDLAISPTTISIVVKEKDTYVDIKPQKIVRS